MAPAPVSGDRRPLIAVIHNDVVLLGRLRALLADAGYQVAAQTRLDPDLSQLAARAPELILLDYRWDEGHGGWFDLRRLRRDPRTAMIPIVLCTGAAVVLKPSAIAQLVQAIADALWVVAERGAP